MHHQSECPHLLWGPFVAENDGNFGETEFASGLSLRCPSTISPSPRTKQGILKPTWRIEAHMRSTAASFLRGLRTYGLSLSIGHISTCVFNDREVIHDLATGTPVRSFAEYQFGASVVNRKVLTALSALIAHSRYAQALPNSGVEEPLSDTRTGDGLSLLLRKFRWPVARHSAKPVSL